ASYALSPAKRCGAPSRVRAPPATPTPRATRAGEVVVVGAGPAVVVGRGALVVGCAGVGRGACVAVVTGRPGGPELPRRCAEPVAAAEPVGAAEPVEAAEPPAGAAS